MVHGPPGTGKTHTLAASILSLVLNKGGRRYSQTDRVRKRQEQTPRDRPRVLVVCSSNKAVDNCLIACKEWADAMQPAKPVRLLRVGVFESVRPRLRPFHLSTVAKDCAIERGVSGASRPGYVPKGDDKFDALYRSDVVFSTFTSLHSVSLASLLSQLAHSFDAVYVDEAGQTSEGETLLGLAAPFVCLFGDHNQLPPTLVSDVSSAFRVSLMERMVKREGEVLLLDTQYRMHPDILRTPNLLFYGGKIKNGVDAGISTSPKDSKGTKSTKEEREREGVTDAVDRALLHQGIQPISCARLGHYTVLDIDGREEKDKNGTSIFNWHQANCVLGLLSLLDCLSPSLLKKVLVLCPYQAQTRLISHLLNKEPHWTDTLSRVSVSTIDGSQGTEADIVIYTTVRSNSRGSLGFTRDPRRMNVALTRAKDRLIVVGSVTTLCCDPTWQSVISDAVSRGRVFDAGERILKALTLPQLESKQKKSRVSEWLRGGTLRLRTPSIPSTPQSQDDKRVNNSQRGSAKVKGGRQRSTLGQRPRLVCREELG
ncbi:hypothetical protein KIPB_005340 [Kipferlia bialata]|uniref:P-loop containing nucleoside triphosphate hydrolase n=1 Tax=Kipferlia bialata TaxID=797122 RepID=A0A9K3CX15_9EUKA|nr:hypothetical protein KIPB_005340 [Kipferlia bialata]|eukprot:g5340.t1